MISQKTHSYRFFGEIEYISISSIKPSPLYNCRDINQVVIETISESIKQYGLIQPIVVKVTVTAGVDSARAEDDHYEIVAGCRRYMACKILNWKKIPCHIVYLNDMQAFEISLVENIQRESLSPLEEAKSFKKYVIDKGWGSISNLSSKIGKSHSYIIKRIAMLNLPLDVQQSIKNYELKPSSAEELLYIKDPERQSQLGKMILKRHLTTIKARKLVRENPYYCENSEIIEVSSELQVFNKSIVILKIAMSKIAQLVEDEDEEDGEKEDERNYDNINDNEGMNSKALRERNDRNSKGIINSKSNLLIKELLMYQKKQLHDQIDILMKAKKKYTKNIVRYRQIMER